jgi:thiol:disulfide interchange protein DsbA
MNLPSLHRRQLVLTLVTTGLTSQVTAQNAAPVEGTHYRALTTPQPVPTNGKIEVIEFFSYACPACNAFDPALGQWAAALPPDVLFRRVPVYFLRNADQFQRAFYALEATGMTAKVHPRLLEAVHVQRRALDKPEDIAAVVAEAGGDAAKFLTAFNGFSMAATLARAKTATSQYGIESIPSLAIGGRFVTSPAMAGGAAQALAVADRLLQKLRGKA